jgi:hypothetical protein
MLLFHNKQITLGGEEGGKEGKKREKKRKKIRASKSETQ